MAVRVRFVTDPACVWSWALEPAVRALAAEFADELEWTLVMAGLARELAPEPLVRAWLDAAGESGMPTDPRVLYEGPIRSTYPACMAVKAAEEQGGEAGRRYVRALREGVFALRRKLDTAEALVEEARMAGLDAERFRIDLSSHAIVEAFGSDLEQARAVPADVWAAGGSRCSRTEGGTPLPLLRFGEGPWMWGFRTHGELREAALAAGARPSERPRPGVLEALARFGRMAAPEVAAVCDLPRPRVEAELAQLVLDWRARTLAVLSDHMWEAA